MEYLKSSNKPSICHTNDEKGAATALGGGFLREDCGFFSKCSRHVEDYDFSGGNQNVVEIWYCALDWTKVLPTMLLTLIIIFFIYRKFKQLKESGSFSRFGRSSSSSSRHHSYSKYGGRRY